MNLYAWSYATLWSTALRAAAGRERDEPPRRARGNNRVAGNLLWKAGPTQSVHPAHRSAAVPATTARAHYTEFALAPTPPTPREPDSNTFGLTPTDCESAGRQLLRQISQ
jgi:hypothetical protein